MEGLEVGKSLDLSLFKEGEHVDVTGTTIGKGFQGGVKRHHFKTQDATHGNSISHRALGSTGQCQDPGRVFKGKKMAGHMGSKLRTILNLEVIKSDVENGLIYIKGSIPGSKNTTVFLRKSKKTFNRKTSLEKFAQDIQVAKPGGKKETKKEN